MDDISNEVALQPRSERAALIEAAFRSEYL